MIVDILVFPVTTKKTVRLYVLKCMNEISNGLKNSAEALNRIHHFSLLDQESSSSSSSIAIEQESFEDNSQNTKKVSLKLSESQSTEQQEKPAAAAAAADQSSKVSEEEQKLPFPTLDLPLDTSHESTHNPLTTPTPVSPPTPTTFIQTMGTNISNTLSVIRRRASSIVEPPPSPILDTTTSQPLSPEQEQEQTFNNIQQTINQNIHQLEVELGMTEVNFYDNNNNNLSHTMIQPINDNIPSTAATATTDMNTLAPDDVAVDDLTVHFKSSSDVSAKVNPKSVSQSSASINDLPTNNDNDNDISSTIQKDLSDCVEFIQIGEITVLNLNKYTAAIDNALSLAVHEPAIIKRFWIVTLLFSSIYYYYYYYYCIDHFLWQCMKL